jgi:pimeloyl-ACP methyl ester carboxylesterase
MSKPHLILVHSFPTNSIILGGLIDFLQDHFTVHFIDLPGFTRAVPPLERVTMDAYADFLRRQIEALGLAEYILGGISFGFLVVNHLSPGPGCKCILAMEPFLGKSTLRLGRFTRFALTVVLSAVLSLHAERLLWRSSWFRRQLSDKDTDHRIDCVLTEIDPRTFLSTARFLLNWNRPVTFHDIRYVLFINPDDGTIAAETVTQVFQTSVAKLLVSSNSVDHYPKDISKEYFANHIPYGEIERIKAFLDR